MQGGNLSASWLHSMTLVCRESPYTLCPHSINTVLATQHDTRFVSPPRVTATEYDTVCQLSISTTVYMSLTLKVCMRLTLSLQFPARSPPQGQPGFLSLKFASADPKQGSHLPGYTLSTCDHEIHV